MYPAVCIGVVPERGFGSGSGKEDGGIVSKLPVLEQAGFLAVNRGTSKE